MVLLPDLPDLDIQHHLQHFLQRPQLLLWRLVNHLSSISATGLHYRQIFLSPSRLILRLPWENTASFDHLRVSSTAVITNEHPFSTRQPLNSFGRPATGLSPPAQHVSSFVEPSPPMFLFGQHTASAIDGPATPISRVHTSFGRPVTVSGLQIPMTPTSDPTNSMRDAHSNKLDSSPQHPVSKVTSHPDRPMPISQPSTPSRNRPNTSPASSHHSRFSSTHETTAARRPSNAEDAQS